MLGEYSRMRAGFRAAGALDNYLVKRGMDVIRRDLIQEALPLP